MITRLREIDTGGGVAIYRVDDRPLDPATVAECRRRLGTLKSLNRAKYFEYSKTLMVHLSVEALAAFDQDNTPGQEILRELIVPLLQDILPPLKVSPMTTQKTTKFHIVE